MVTIEDIRSAVRELGLTGHPLCVHASLRSFGWVEGGAATVVDGLLEEGCTVMVPAWTVVNPDATIDKGMGAIAAEVVKKPGRIRGNHPFCSFAATGPLSTRLVVDQTPLDVFAPLRALTNMGGFVVLMGVGLHRMTLIHLAEQQAGRKLFQRQANGPDGPTWAEIGGCSLNFGNLWPYLKFLVTERKVGDSRWLVLRAKEALFVATKVIQENPTITHCNNPTCARCNRYQIGETA